MGISLFPGIVALAFAVAGLTGCAGRDLYPRLKDDKRLMVRLWTQMTQRDVLKEHGSDFSNPVVSDNMLIYGSKSRGLTALYPKLNQERWNFPIPGGVVSELTIDKGAVFFTGANGELYSVNIETGVVNWKYDLRNPVTSRCVISGGRLFVTTSDDTVYAFDAGTGKWLWHYRRRSAQSSTVLGASAPLVDGKDVFVGLSDGFVVQLSLQDGQLKWEKKIHQGTRFTDVDATPVLDQGILYIPSYDGALYALKRSNGDIVWRFDAGGSKDIIIEDQRIFLPSSNGTIYALQKNNAKILWKFELDRGTPTRLTVVDDFLAFGSSFQYLYLIKRSDGTPVYRFNTGSESGFYGSPAWDSKQKRLYILSAAGNLHAFALRQPPKKTYWLGKADPYEDFHR